MSKIFTRLFILSVIVGLFACNNQPDQVDEAKQSANPITDNTRIVSLNGTLTEIIALAGLDNKIVGTDVTSTYPVSMHQLPKVGHVRNLQAEGILALQPTIVMAMEKEIKPEILVPLQSAGVKVLLYSQEYTTDGTKKLIASVLKDLQQSDKQHVINTAIDEPISQLTSLSSKPKVLFIYARGGGNLMVAGDDTPIKTFIELSGAQNAVNGFTDYKPLTPEILVKANPDVLLLFDTGLKSLEGNDGLLALPGMKETNAAKKNHVIAMDGQYLSGFGPRVGKAALDLNTQLKALGY
jgi:iron complex transport system substrate-binding protein